MNEVLYNTEVRRAMSDKYVESMRRRAEITKKLDSVSNQLIMQKDTIPYREYCHLQKVESDLIRKVREVEIEIDTWDKARELCIEIEDEMRKKR